MKIVFFKTRVASDGFLTPGQPETVSVSHMPGKTDFKMAIEPPPTTLQCGQFYFCDVAPVTPVPGSPPFQTDKKGEAVVTFVMPSTYNIATDPFDPGQPASGRLGQRPAGPHRRPGREAQAPGEEDRLRLRPGDGADELAACEAACRRVHGPQLSSRRP